jgi:hypothetical protein
MAIVAIVRIIFKEIGLAVAIVTAGGQVVRRLSLLEGFLTSPFKRLTWFYDAAKSRTTIPSSSLHFFSSFFVQCRENHVHLCGEFIHKTSYSPNEAVAVPGPLPETVSLQYHCPLARRQYCISSNYVVGKNGHVEERCMSDKGMFFEPILLSPISNMLNHRGLQLDEATTDDFPFWLEQRALLASIFIFPCWSQPRWVVQSQLISSLHSHDQTTEGLFFSLINAKRESTWSDSSSSMLQ